MAGNANSGRRRVLIPKGEEAEEELRRIRRQERRRERAAKKKRAASGLPPEEEDEDGPPPPVEGSLDPPSLAEFKSDLMYAFNEMGGRAGLVAWGRRYPKEFYSLWVKYFAPKEDDAPEANSLEAMLAQLSKRNEETVN